MSQLISVVLPDLRGGGAERVSVDLAQAFTVVGYTVEFVLTSARGEFLPEVQTKYDVVDLRIKKIRQAPLALARYLKTRRPAAMIANMWPLTTAAVVARMLSRQRFKLLLVEHGTLSRQYASWGSLHQLMLRGGLAANCRWADHVAAVSQGAGRDLAALAKVPAERIKVLNNPIRQQDSPRPEVRARADAWWNTPPGERVLTVGTFKQVKNHSLLIRAFALLARPACRLMLLGQGQNEAMLRKLAAELGVTDRVIFPGFHTDTAPFYATADLFVLSSDHEGLPTVLIEALSFGLPVVSTNCPSGPSEILENGRHGRLVPVGDAQALAEAMDEALARSVDRPALKRRSLDFAPETAARKYLDLLGLG